mmetsp:Transcript_56796/g.183979  ORF Transcript_56796/g.183979 Transcript_56796/m.183979 type:complete len:281 (+) Transcript_56796:68-910(+)
MIDPSIRVHAHTHASTHSPIRTPRDGQDHQSVRVAPLVVEPRHCISNQGYLLRPSTCQSGPTQPGGRTAWAGARAQASAPAREPAWAQAWANAWAMIWPHAWALTKEPVRARRHRRRRRSRRRRRRRRRRRSRRRRAWAKAWAHAWQQRSPQVIQQARRGTLRSQEKTTAKASSEPKDQEPKAPLAHQKPKEAEQRKTHEKSEKPTKLQRWPKGPSFGAGPMASVKPCEPKQRLRLEPQCTSCRTSRRSSRSHHVLRAPRARRTCPAHRRWHGLPHRQST